MKRGDTRVCTNCQIEEELQKKRSAQPSSQDNLEEQSGGTQLSGAISTTSRKTVPELNTAGIKFKSPSARVKKEKLLAQIKEESDSLNPNIRFAKSSKRNQKLRTQSATANQFAQSEAPRGNSFRFEPLSVNAGPQSAVRGRAQGQNSILSTNSFLEKNLVQETIISDDKSLNLMSEINQAYLEQIKATIEEIRSSDQLSNIEKFRMMKDVMQEYKVLVGNST